jgi:uncharacterized membrane protein YidH (DUF202 family)
MRVEKAEAIDSNVFSEVQLILAEKRTALSSMRTGIAVFALPLSVLSVLVATSKYYDILHVLHFLIPLLVLSLALIILGSYLILHSVWRIRHHDRLIKELKLRYRAIGEFIV